VSALNLGDEVALGDIPLDPDTIGSLQREFVELAPFIPEERLPADIIRSAPVATESGGLTKFSSRSPAGTKPQDAMEAEAVTVMDLNGNTNTFSWETAYGKRLPAEKNVDGPIQIVNLKSKNRHFVIGETGAHFKPFTFGALKEYSNFPNWNHWPVAKLPNDGRVAPAPDRPSSSCPGTLYAVRHIGEGIQEYVRDLYGMTDRDPKHLATLARSWNNPLVLELLGEAFANEGYDKNQQAYVLSHKGQGKPAELTFSIKASEEYPVVNVPMVIKNWGGHEARLILDGKPVAQGKAFRVGHRRGLEVTDLIVWIQVESRTPQKFWLSAE
jgi:hypothetical protein